MNQIARDSLDERVEQLEAKERAEEERRRQEKEAQRAGRRGLRRIGERVSSSTLAPVSTPSSIDEATTEVAADPVESFYREQAKRILDVIDSDPREGRLRANEAVAAIKKQFPLTHPGEQEIVKRLERVVVELRAEAPASAPATDAITPPTETAPFNFTRAIDALVGKTLDAKKTRTYGSVGSADD